jgi:TonB-dependent SusC/RagA subfamily outer membrane receptor
MPKPLRTTLPIALLFCAACWSGPTPSSPAPGRGDVVHVAGESDGGNRLEEILTGSVPGLTVLRRADGTYSVRLRGSRGAADGEPLVLLDGVPMGGGTAHALADINPRDVARVEVVKDAASLSLYGVRAANGVIAITTRTR